MCVYRSPASVIQDHLVELDYYCRVGWVGWREVAVSVDSLVYRSSSGGSWRRGRARRNAALQRPCARGSQAKGDPRSRRGEEEEAAEEEDEDYSQSPPQRVTVWSFLGTGYVVLCSLLTSGSFLQYFAGALVPDFLSFFLCLFFPLHLRSIFFLSACPPPPPVPRITSSQVLAV